MAIWREFLFDSNLNDMRPRAPTTVIVMITVF